MTWQLSSPDLPFLNHITVVQLKHGVLEHLLPLAPFISVGATVWIAYQARKITLEQKRIAQKKLDLDLFIKRMEIYDVFARNISLMTSRKDISDEKLSESWVNLKESLYKSRLLLLSESYSDLIFISNKITKIYNIRKKGREGKKELEMIDMKHNVIMLYHYLNHYIKYFYNTNLT